MPMTLIKGSFKILNAAPDGDSIRFYPNNPDLWKQLKSPVRTNKSGGAQLRLDAIDTLETHYQPKGGSLGVLGQPKKFGEGAAQELLTFLGFTSVRRKAGEIVTSATPDAVPGYILTRFADKYGRSVAFAYKGSSPEADGGSVNVTPQLLKKSANFHLLQVGLAYPTFYSKLFVDLRKALTKAAVEARTSKKGLWAEDKTNNGFELDSLATLTDEAVILPKLFRRLVDYLAINDGSEDLGGFEAFLKALDDRVIILPDGQVTGFDFVVKTEGQKVSLSVLPENLVFMEK
jgi:endonuclease YncB( thermonuclease family)